ncbi:hypothetical protein JYU22_04425 [Gammaproteobacteria bacterium AH-315-E17]|nr:hypothetical protein [Gammaproteobacteria bacterium AH-315-E17]
MKSITLTKVLGCTIILIFSMLANAQQIDFSGEWRPIFHEDAPERVPGPGFGDFSGIPINDAARMRGESYDTNRISIVTEYICRQHGGDYAMRGLADLRILRDIDPRTQATVAFKTRMGFHNMQRTIWLDGRQHPSVDAPHTFQGFSTGVWEGNMLTITTTHLKQSYLRRNGLPASSERTFTEHWLLHGKYLTVITVINDPVFLTEPMLRSQDFEFDPTRRGGFNNCEYTTEVPINPDNLVPNYLPGENPYLDEFAEIYHLPMSGVRGGAETLYPEFREEMGPPVGDRQFCTNEDCDA